jgi:hypothetical protein
MRTTRRELLAILAAAPVAALVGRIGKAKTPASSDALKSAALSPILPVVGYGFVVFNDGDAMVTVMNLDRENGVCTWCDVEPHSSRRFSHSSDVPVGSKPSSDTTIARR